MKPFANPARGEVLLELGAESFLLRPSFEALVEIEEQAGSLFAIVERAGAGEVTLKDVMSVIHACARAGGADVTRERLGALIAEHGLTRASAAFARVLGHALKGPE